MSDLVTTLIVVGILVGLLGSIFYLGYTSGANKIEKEENKKEADIAKDMVEKVSNEAKIYADRERSLDDLISSLRRYDKN